MDGWVAVFCGTTGSVGGLEVSGGTNTGVVDG